MLTHRCLKQSSKMHLIFLKKVQASFSMMHEELTYACVLLLILPWLLTSLEFWQVENGAVVLWLSIFSNDHFVLSTPPPFIFGYFSGFKPLTVTTPTDLVGLHFLRVLSMSFCSLYSFFMSLETLFFRETLVFSTILYVQCYLKLFVTDKKLEGLLLERDWWNIQIQSLMTGQEMARY